MSTTWMRGDSFSSFCQYFVSLLVVRDEVVVADVVSPFLHAGS